MGAGMEVVGEADTVVAGVAVGEADTVAEDTGVPVVEGAEATQQPTHGNVADAASTKMPTTARVPIQSNEGA